jgi:hypothetical protein
MPKSHYRVERAIALRTAPVRVIDVRCYVEADSASQARLLSLRMALSCFAPGFVQEILGRDFVIVVPGVKGFRGPEVRSHGRRFRVYGTPDSERPLGPGDQTGCE